MELQLTQDDVQLMLSEVRRFCQRSIRPLVERPERLITADELARLTEQAKEIGLVNLDAESGVGLWENVDGPHSFEFGTRALRYVAQENAGIAFHFHQLALGAWVARCLGLSSSGAAIVCVQGAYGLARHSLARLLKERPLRPDDVHLLHDYFITLDGPDQHGPRENLPLLFQAADDWQQLLVPCFDRSETLHWAVFERDDLHVDRIEYSHGLNETFTWKWQRRGETPQHLFADGASCLTLYSRALDINAQAMVAIALGAVEQGHSKVVEYAALRVQGGKPIDQHVAVQKMLANCSSTVRTVDLLQQQSTQLEMGADRLGTTFSVRAQAHNLLCTAANDIMQAFGGIGYMRDTGIEKIVRDNNHLRQLYGTPSELLMFLAEWEKAE